MQLPQLALFTKTPKQSAPTETHQSKTLDLHFYPNELQNPHQQSPFPMNSKSSSTTKPSSKTKPNYHLNPPAIANYPQTPQQPHSALNSSTETHPALKRWQNQIQSKRSMLTTI
ncbi:hypothetical protein M758_3G111200 [Ceratodon purpureus]|uniref:Uncharacterized protein n=1 Tax=Ceratodon purpureus TaxID=3225 RepID=A0A8T0IH78_CERPU|nr:hypothetical protein KC19_3G109400 [Ceratodon purpureus]KAG0622610.1 hypothetical protein M758_3G111200 [Ceratodon purpureus]